MNNKKNAYVKKEKLTKKDSTNNTVKELSILEQQQLLAEIIIDTNTGVFVDYSEKEKLKNYIANYFDLFLEGNLKSNGVGLHKYSRKNLTEKLANLLNRKTL